MVQKVGNSTDASISAKQHIRNFSRHCGSYVNGADKHEDVYMTLFALSLDGKAGNWYNNLPNNSFTTIAASRLRSSKNLVAKRNLDI